MTSIKRLCDSCPKCPQPVMSQVRLMDHQLAMMLRCIQIENTRSRPKTMKIYRPKDWLPPLHPYEQKQALPDPDREVLDEYDEHDKPVIGLMMDKPGTGKTFVMLSMVIADLERRKLTRIQAPRETTVVVVPGHIYHQWWHAMLQIFSTQAICLHEHHYNNDANGILWTKVRNNQDCAHLDQFFSSHGNDALDILLVHMNCYQAATDTLFSLGIFPKRVIIDEVDGWQASTYIDQIIPCKTAWLISSTLLSYVEECIDAKTQFDYAGLILHPDKIPDNSVLCEDEFIAQSIHLSEADERYLICRDELVDACYQNTRRDIVEKINALYDPFNGSPIYDMNTFTADCITSGYAEKLVKTITKRITHHAPNDQGIPAKTAACYYGLPGDHSIYRDVNHDNHDKWPSSTAHTDDITEESIIDVMTIQSNSKIGAFIDIVKEILASNDRPRILIAAMYDASLKVAAQVLDMLHVSWRILAMDEDLTKSDTEYEDALLSFHKGSADALLINATAYGNGLNLQCTTDLVNMHAMPENLQVQVIGRAQRPGRQGQLVVWNLVHGNEVEQVHSDTDDGTETISNSGSIKHSGDFHV